MRNYYFIAASLPELKLGEKPEISFEELVYRLSLNLSKDDLEKTVVLRRYIDILNIRALLLEEPLDSRGNLNEKELDEALLLESFFPPYVFDYLNQYEDKKDQIRNFSSLLIHYFSEEVKGQEGFLKKYLIFEREWRLVVAALRAKKLKWDITRELQFEDFTEPVVADILAQKDVEQYEPPAEFQDLKELIHACGDDPWALFKAISEYRFQKIEEMSGYPLFSMDWILGYMARLILVEQWVELDEEKGKNILENFKTG
ncbi:MAG TPA: DUF2764 family protein [Rhabdochlamydiaceae bacterium]|nr:DUF2764 family protein [Rhabdochlamydiaceae bacterium]